MVKRRVAPSKGELARARVLAVLVLVPYEMRLELRDGEDGEVEERSWTLDPIVTIDTTRGTSTW
jgi:hypothetical protein